jgi:hypothetical protein
MITKQCMLTRLPVAVVLASSPSFSPLAQGASDRPAISAESLRGLRNLNDPGNGGQPLPRPAQPGAQDSKPDQALVQLCLRLKASGASPDFCK